MKKALYFLALIFWSCGGSTDDEPPVEKTNTAPTIPGLMYPTNNLLCTDNIINFNWNASNDLDNDPIIYTIEVSANNQFNPIEFTAHGNSTSQNFTLKKSVSYYWRVKAADNKNASSGYSSVFNFYTEGEAVSNHLPFAPHLETPKLNDKMEAGAVVLKWSASDVDEDPLSYDVYFGTENPPTSLLVKNHNSTEIEVNPNLSTDYYWKVVVKDNRGGITEGQVWTFTTE